MEVIQAERNDLDVIMPLFDAARAFMAKTGNPNQWKSGYPTKEMIIRDIAAGNFFLVKQQGRICGCFAYILGEDVTYRHIDGAWNSDAPYGTIHRIASDHTVHGVFDAALSYAKSRCSHVRADTHADNAVMQKLLKNAGFTYCGIIYIADGSPRLAYEFQTERSADHT